MSRKGVTIMKNIFDVNVNYVGGNKEEWTDEFMEMMCFLVYGWEEEEVEGFIVNDKSYAFDIDKLSHALCQHKILSCNYSDNNENKINLLFADNYKLAIEYM